MSRVKKIISSIFIVVLLLWIFLAILRTVNNAFKFFREDFGLFYLTDTQNRINTYGEVYSFCLFAKENTPSRSTILFLSSGAKPFYFCRYQLYPRQLFLARNQDEVKVLLKKKEFNYFLVYRSSNPLENENNSSEWNLDMYNFILKYKNKSGADGGLVKL